MRKTIKNLWFFGAIALSTIITISCGDDDDPFIEPDVAFTTSITDLTVIFTNNTTDAATADYSWNFGDGVGTSEEISPTYTYADYGQYTVTLTVTKEGQVFTESTSIELLDVCDLRAADPGNLIIGGQFEGCDAEAWTAIVSNEGGAAEPATHGPAKWEFGYTDYAPTNGDGGALYIFPDNDESELDEATILYQQIQVTERGSYQLSGLMRASGSANLNSYFFQIYVGETEPVNNMDYNDNYVSGVVDFTDFSFGVDLPPTDGPMVHNYTPPATSSDDEGRFNLFPGTYYVAIKFGKGTDPSFDLGIAIDNLELRRVGDVKTTPGVNLIEGGNFNPDDAEKWTHYAGGSDPKVDLRIGEFNDGDSLFTPDASWRFGDNTALLVKEPTPGGNSSSTIWQNLGPLNSGMYQLEAFLKIDADIDNGGTVDNGWFEIVVSTRVPEDGVGYDATSDTDNYGPEKWVAAYNEFECGGDWPEVLGVADGNPDNAFNYDFCDLGLADNDGKFEFSNPNGDDVYIAIKAGTFEGTLGSGASIDFLSLKLLED